MCLTSSEKNYIFFLVGRYYDGRTGLAALRYSSSRPAAATTLSILSPISGTLSFMVTIARAAAEGSTSIRRIQVSCIAYSREALVQQLLPGPKLLPQD